MGDSFDVENNSVCITYPGVFGVDSYQTFLCNTPYGMCGQYVTVQRTLPVVEELNARLTVCEIQVYGEQSYFAI